MGRRLGPLLWVELTHTSPTPFQGLSLHLAMPKCLTCHTTSLSPVFTRPCPPVTGHTH